MPGSAPTASPSTIEVGCTFSCSILLDFTRMLSVFEKYGISFVAVTQQFNI